MGAGRSVSTKPGTRDQYPLLNRKRDGIMRRYTWMPCAACLLMLACSGCGSTKVSTVGLISFGDLEGRTIPSNPKGPVLQGTDAAMPFVMRYSLSNAARDALKDTPYDTLVDAEVTAKTGLFVPSNKIIVKGTALNSDELPRTGSAE